MLDKIKAGLKRVANEPLVAVGVIVAGLNTATDQSWKGYAVAVAVALLRFVVTGPFTEPGPKAD